ncbi:MAG: hypothetical protein AAFP18_18155, partial [Bacteroidota bacterium]
LYSDQEYEWPEIYAPGMRWSYEPRWFERLLRIDRQVKENTLRFLDHGDYSVWPFVSREKYQEALLRPVLLSGRV